MMGLKSSTAALSGTDMNDPATARLRVRTAITKEKMRKRPTTTTVSSPAGKALLRGFCCYDGV
jgi:hypothetical protein